MFDRVLNCLLNSSWLKTINVYITEISDVKPWSTWNVMYAFLHKNQICPGATGRHWASAGRQLGGSPGLPPLGAESDLAAPDARAPLGATGRQLGGSPGLPPLGAESGLAAPDARAPLGATGRHWAPLGATGRQLGVSWAAAQDYRPSVLFCIKIRFVKKLAQ